MENSGNDDEKEIGKMTRPIRLLPELEPLINRPFTEKWLESTGLVAHNLMELGKNCAVAFSGGKDSTIAVWLATRFYPDIPVVFNNTGVEYPETIQFVHKLANNWNLNLIETKPEMTFWDCVDKWGFPVPRDRYYPSLS
jgi:3'-phosphoadenosine 5'-phosphosulfate sulfotransferase (PAPS reductase)/FAD synthetase